MMCFSGPCFSGNNSPVLPQRPVNVFLFLLVDFWKGKPQYLGCVPDELGSTRYTLVLKAIKLLLPYNTGLWFQ